MFRGFLFIILVCISIFDGIAYASMCQSFYSEQNSKQTMRQNPQVNTRAIETAHQEITETLYIGYPVKVKPFSANNNRNPLWLVTLENPKTKKQVTALFKPRNFGDGDGWNRVPMEYVSYEIARMLDMDIIPPVAYREKITLNGQFFHEGSMQYFVQGATLLKEIEKSNWNLNSDLFVSNARVLDVLLQNPDRHVGNFIYGPHWVDGISRPLLIDQAANLRKGTNMRLSTKGPFNSDLITEFDPQTIQKLKELNQKKLSRFIPFITQEEINQILERRDGILKFIDSHSSGK